MPVPDSVAALPDDCRDAARHLVLACADTKLLLGFHYGEWTFGPPALEAAVSCCSMAQAEFGHVRLLHGILRSVFGDDPDALVEKRDTAEFANVTYLDHPLTDWPTLVAANYVVDHGLTRVLESLALSAFKPLRTGMDKMIDEERFHRHHARGWFRTLARSGAEREVLGRRVSSALASVVAWLGPADDAGDRALVRAGIRQAGGAALAEALVAEISADAASVGVEVEPPNVRFERWSPQTRRMDAGSPDAGILLHLRGAANEVFKVA
jgi:ring-1,2-phenylacetyl-CoA epoxidase subunit PaaC